MHTLMVTAAGLLLLGLFLLAGHWARGGEPGGLVLAAWLFLPVWLAGSLINLWVGVSRAGYTVLQELPILVPVFGIPALAAALVIWRIGEG